MAEKLSYRQRPLALAIITALNFAPAVQAACVSLSSLSSAYSQNFDSLANNGTTNTLSIPGWTLTETGGGSRDNEQYGADNGSSNTGDTYSYGATAGTERALGGLQSGSLVPVFGACFTNNTGSTISSLDIAYTGEEWRLGTTGRGADRINFEYSTNATDLATGSWTGVSALNFSTPNIPAVASALDGNAVNNRTAISSTISSIAIPNGATFWVRWTDTNASSSDDGLAVDDFSLTANGTASTVPNLSINDVSVNEGNSGTTNYNFTVSLSSPAGVGGASFDIATADGTATTGDYTSNALAGQSIPEGSSTYTFTVSVNGDTTVEPNETFFVNVSNVTGANVADVQGLGTIVNEDLYPITACGEPATKISTVQGSGATTPLNNLAGTTIEGIVVGDYQGTSANSLRGYFVQEEDADSDGDPATSEGIFVFDSNTTLANVKVGDKVRIIGTPGEFFDMTQMGSLYNVQICASNQAIPTAAALTLPVPSIPNGNLTTATNAINAYYEKYEGMLVNFPATLSVSEYFELERYGQLVLSQGGRIPTFSNVTNPSVLGYTNHQITLAKRQIILDDINNIQNFALSSGQPLPYPTGGLSITNRFRGGDTINNLTGILHWSFAGQSGTDAWRIRPVEELFDYTFTSANPRKPTSPNVGGTLKVASFNVLNYFTTIDTTSSNNSGPCGPDGIQDCRGADSAEELARQTAKAATALCGINADIFGLMEIENNATASLSSLVNAANAINGCGPYAFINTGTVGGDAIKVGLLYKTTTVSPMGSHALLTTAVDARFIDTKNRPSIAQTFREISSGEKLTVAVNHLKSKGSACTDIDVTDIDANDGQGNCNKTRTKAAQALVDWLNSDPTASGDTDYLLIGDLNSYAKEDPIKAIENGADDTANTTDDFTNLVKNFGGAGAYSYVFDGQTGYLDHALASKSLLTQVTDATDWHINSDEPPSFDYNDTVVTTGEASFEAKPSALPLYEANQYRTSDHDPVIIGVKLGETINIINGTTVKDTLLGTPGKDRITGLGAADVISGGLGNDEFVYTGTTEGIDTITDFTLGQDKIVLTALLQSLQYQGLNPIADGVIKFATSGNNTIVYIDADGNAGPAVKRALISVSNISVANLKNAANFVF